MVLEQRDLWEVVSGDIKMELRHAVISGDVQAQVPQGTGNHLSHDEGFAAAVGPVGEWSA